MKKIIPFIIVLLLLAGCSYGNQEELDELYNAFERNHSEIEEDFKNYYSEIDSSDDREIQLKIIYDELIPMTEDFRTTIENYTVSNKEHESLKENMLSYIDSLKELTELNGEFNRKFVSSNPLSDENFTDDINSMLQEIEDKENEVKNGYDNITEEYENLTSEQ
ncbi:hypothetical protein [Salinicoccus sp. HZC-1]|uniref:hypothetical protein n=1 Tax=Salinicoccus sp. HZC-1 TaxID=3385497 RepID=UPI00398B6C7E